MSSEISGLAPEGGGLNAMRSLEDFVVSVDESGENFCIQISSTRLDDWLVVVALGNVHVGC
jgi:hypothetical protein